MDELIEAIRYDFECLCDDKLLAAQKLRDNGDSEELIQIQDELYDIYKQIAKNPESFIHKILS